MFANDAPTTCRAGEVEFHVALIGAFAPGSSDRTSPYYLRMQTEPGLVRSGLELRSLKLAPVELTEPTDVSDARPMLVDVEGVEVLVIVRSSIELAYSDYDLIGEIQRGDEETHRLACTLARKRWHEWRSRAWDAFMSV